MAPILFKSHKYIVLNFEAYLYAMRIMSGLALLLLTLLSSCFLHSGDKAGEPFSADDPQDKKLKKLQGEWFCVKVQPFFENKEQELEQESELAVFKEDMELSVMEFKDDELLSTSKTYDTYKDGAIHWGFAAPNAIRLSETNAPAFNIVHLAEDTLVIGANLVPASYRAKPVVLASFARISSKKYGDENLFAPGINLWRNIPAAAESREQIVSRLKGMLSYNYVYIRSLYYSSATFINTRKFNMPFVYYNGGIGLKDEIDNKGNFANYFYDKKDATLALGILRDAFSRVEYVRKANYVLEYADFMKALSEKIR